MNVFLSGTGRDVYVRAWKEAGSGVIRTPPAGPEANQANPGLPRGFTHLRTKLPPPWAEQGVPKTPTVSPPHTTPALDPVPISFLGPGSAPDPNTPGGVT